MKAVFTPGPRSDLDDILSYLASHYPGSVDAFERRLTLVLRRLEMWPESAAAVTNHSAVHVVPLVRYPYKIFHRVADVVEILHIHHASRKPRIAGS